MRKQTTQLVLTKSIKTLLLLNLCLVAIGIRAQSPMYLFSQNSGTYTPITGGTVYSSGSAMDDASISYSLPFTYTFNGTPYTSGYANENGFITFGNTVLNASTRRVISNAQTGFEAAAPFAQDLGGLNASSEMRGELLGTAPNRTFVVQWSNMVEYLGDFASFNFQVRINEGGGVAANQKVEFVYGNCTNIWADLSPQVGLRGVNNTQYINRTSFGTSWVTNTAGTGNNDGCYFSASIASVAPVSGLTFIWTRIFPVVTYTGSLSSFTSCSGTASAIQTLAVSGSSLSGNIIITTPSGMEVSSTSSTSGFGNSAILVRSNYTVAPTTLYFRTTSSASGTLSANVTISNFGTTTQSIAVNATVNALPVISASNATICSGQSYTIVPGGANTYTISGGNFVVSPSSTTSYSITGNSGAGCPGSNTLVTTITTTNCVPGAALAFDGSDDYVLTNGFSNFTEYTIEGWFKLNSLTDQNIIVGTDIASGPNAFYSNQLRLQGGKFVNYIYDGSAKTVSSSVTPNTGVWYHVAIIGKNGSPLRINVNGTEDVGGSNVGILQTGLSSYRLAGSAAGVLAPFNGYMDEVRIWNRAMCAGEIINNMNAEIATTASSLVANYHFNQGNDGLNNSAFTTLTDASGASFTGTLTNFSLNGSTSNWVQPGAVTSGSNVAAFISPTVSISGADVLCSGSSAITLTAGGMTSYTWTSGPNTNTFAVTPTITTTYSVSGTNSLGCVSTTALKTITANPAISTSTNVANVPCFGGNNGSATVSANGGTSPYSYLWSGAQTTSVISGQISGVKTVTVTDANSCTTTINANITQPASALATSTTATNILCFGNATGAATVTASGGTSPYTYFWSTGHTTSVITGQTFGVKTVTVIDANSCTSLKSLTISQPTSALATATVVSNVACFGNSTGAATVTASGGTSPYTYLWSGAQTTSVISGQLTGLRTVTVTDANSCTTTVTANITQPASALATSTTVTNILCFGNATGAATVTASGGSSPYTYLWSGAQTTSVISGQTSGARTVTVTDANSCTTTNTVNITQPVSGMTTSTAVANVLCFGASTGAATVTASGGAGSYTYLWSGAQTTSVISGQTFGVRTVTVTDASACTSSNTITIAQPASALGTSTSITNVLCFGAATGAATVTASGGTSPYTYLWSGAQTTSVISGQTSGVKTVTITDANTCTTTRSITITQPASALATSTTVTNILCFGNATGAATVTASGGSSPYTYLWSGAQTTSVISGQTSGARTVTVTDANSCTTTNTVNITQPVSGMTTSTAVANVLCFGASTGGATVTASGGAGSYTYLWSGAQTTSVISAQTQGIRTVTVTDASGCTSTNTVNINQPPAALSTATTAIHVLCFGASTGAATVTASGGTSPYTYLWSGAQTTSVVTNLNAAARTVTVTDANNCVNINTVNITQPASALSSATAAINVLCNGLSTGAATVIASGGTSPYTYLWNTSATTSVITGQTAGVKTVTVTDANVCASTINITITQPPVLTLTATGSSSIVCTGSSGTLTASGSGGTGAITFTWVSGPTNSVNVVSPATSSVYTVNASDANNCLSATTVSLNVSPLPTISVNSGSICSGQSFTISPTGANTYTVQGGNMTVSPTSNTSYTVVGTNTSGCVSQNPATSSVTVNANPSISVNSGSICSGQTFTISPSGANTYTIEGGNNTVSPTANTSYTVTGTSTAGCLSQNTATSNVVVNANPSITVNSGSICAGQTFTISPSGAGTYTVQGGNNIVSPTSNTSYTVTGTSTAGCLSQNTATSNIIVNANPTVTVNSGSICAGQTFTISPSGANSYTVQGGSNTVSPTSNTSYTVIGTNTLGCLSQTAISNITVNALPVLTVTSSKNLLCVGEEATLTASGATTYTWSTSSLSANVVVSPTTTSTYTVTGVGNNGCSGVAITTQSVDACNALVRNKANQMAQMLNIYPNPNIGVFTIHAESEMKVTILSETGQIVRIISLTDNNNYSINVRDLSNGIYFAIIQKDAETIRQKIIVTN